MSEYPDIGDHGLIGDLQTCALVATDGTIDWFCCPRFDSPSTFASLLDSERGGYCRVAPDRAGYMSRQLYPPGTAVLITRFMTSDGVGELADFMPIAHGRATDRHRIVHVLRVVRGRMGFVVQCQPRFDYGRGSHKTEILADGVAFHGADGSELALHIARRPGVAVADAVQREREGDGVRAFIDVAADEVGGFILESAPDTAPRQIQPTSHVRENADLHQPRRSLRRRDRPEFGGDTVQENGRLRCPPHNRHGNTDGRAPPDNEAA